MGPLLLPGVVLAIVVAFGAILWYLFKSAEADSTPFYPDDNEGSDGGSETSKNRTKKRPFQPRRRNRERTTHPVEETPQAARLEERNTHAGANVAKSATTTAKKPAGERSPPARKGAAAAAPTPTIAPTSHPVSRQASDPVLPGKSRKVSFSEDAVTEAAGQETRTTAVPTASSNGVSPPSVPSAKANKAAAKSSSSTKVKNPAKSKPSRSAASASVACKCVLFAFENQFLAIKTSLCSRTCTMCLCILHTCLYVFMCTGECLSKCVQCHTTVDLQTSEIRPHD